MASNQFKDALKRAKKTKDLNTFVQGSGKYMGPGTYDVVIAGVDTSVAAENKVTITYENSDGKTHVDRSFLTSQEGDLSHTIRALLGAAIPNLEALDKFWDELGESESALEMLTGMRLRITLGFGKGCTIQANSNSKYVIVDGDKTVSDLEFNNYKDAGEEIKAMGLKRAFLNVQKAEAINGPANIASLEFALAAVKRKREGGTGNISAFVSGV